jgi:hypothetical protein
MKIPILVGIIDRRILINYQADEAIVKRFLPPVFKPKLIKGKAIVGICLIRLKCIRPKGFPASLGISSENGAHRIAVEWKENGELKEGVYIPRRDTSSTLNSVAGGRVFPGVHHLAKFDVKEENEQFNIAFKSNDNTYLAIEARESNAWNNQSIFDNPDSASEFFKQGSIGYSPTRTGKSFHGLELKTKKWEVSALTVTKVQSSFFENKSVFPEGSIEFDNALLMKNIEHEWRSKGKISVEV